ncbi:DUF4326 domain-containing protein [Mycolicibacterium fortuitum]|uniref:DUF4326 domain-containing protein n=1 Tax=Mycolicibacterium fortuitum TaxID=1766 RepID=UPI0007EC1D5F|nr:DUF4326 domain-containing protein [Mycolicibacterium fortuitum]
MPERIQRKRTAGWRMPEDAIYVGRPTKWGNPFKVGEQCQLWHQDCSQGARPGDMHRDWFTVVDAAHAVRLFAACVDPADDRYTDMIPGVPTPADIEVLRGHDLVCWCPLDQPCHADVLLAIANQEAHS